MPNPETLVSPALVTSAQASGVVAAALHDTERAIDHSLIRIGALLQTLPEARLSAGLAACVGQRALEELGGVVTDCISARARLVRMHGRLTRDAAMLGVDVSVLTGGETKPADDGTPSTPRPQGRWLQPA